MGKSVIVVCSATDAGERIEILHVANFTIVHTRGRITNGAEQPTRIHRSMKKLNSVESPPPPQADILAVCIPIPQSKPHKRGMNIP